MPVTIGKRTFEGPFTGVGRILDEAGVYVVVCPDTDGGLNRPGFTGGSIS